jgi:hypothetical protein
MRGRSKSRLLRSSGFSVRQVNGKGDAFGRRRIWAMFDGAAAGSTA